MSKAEFIHQLLRLLPNLEARALQFTRQPEDAQDLLHDTVLKALLARRRFQQGTDIKAWLFTIMRNTFLSNQRREDLRRAAFDLNLTSDQMETMAGTYSSVHPMDLKFIHQAMQNIRPEHRIPFLLFFQGYSYKEIGNYMDLSVANVKIRIHLARKELRQYLEELK
ncbi:MAG: RNA polymerase sigma factor, partial [Bacteroidota bacterium]